MLIASGRWRVFFAAGVTAVALLAASVALGGVESWHAYIVKALPLQREVLQDAAGTAMPFHPTMLHEYPRDCRQPHRRDHPARVHARRRRRGVGGVPLAARRRPAHAAGAVPGLHGVGLALYGRLRPAAAYLCCSRADRGREARRERPSAGAARIWTLPCNSCSARYQLPGPASSRRCLRHTCCSGCSSRATIMPSLQLLDIPQRREQPHPQQRDRDSRDAAEHG